MPPDPRRFQGTNRERFLIYTLIGVIVGMVALNAKVYVAAGLLFTGAAICGYLTCRTWS